MRGLNTHRVVELQPKAVAACVDLGNVGGVDVAQVGHLWCGKCPRVSLCQRTVAGRAQGDRTNTQPVPPALRTACSAAGLAQRSRTRLDFVGGSRAAVPHSQRALTAAGRGALAQACTPSRQSPAAGLSVVQCAPSCADVACIASCVPDSSGPWYPSRWRRSACRRTSTRSMSMTAGCRGHNNLNIEPVRARRSHSCSPRCGGQD